MPNSYGAGISYVKENRLTLAADFLYEDWANAYFDNEKGQFKNRTRVAAGAEFIPRYDNRNYLGRIRYRAGFHYSNSYLRVSRLRRMVIKDMVIMNMGRVSVLGFH